MGGKTTLAHSFHRLVTITRKGGKRERGISSQWCRLTGAGFSPVSCSYVVHPIIIYTLTNFAGAHLSSRCHLHKDLAECTGFLGVAIRGLLFVWWENLVFLRFRQVLVLCIPNVTSCSFKLLLGEICHLWSGWRGPICAHVCLQCACLFFWHFINIKLIYSKFTLKHDWIDL